MKVHSFKATQFVSRDVESVFDFFKKPENLARLTPASLGFQILTPGPIQMEKGRLIDYTIKIFGMNQRWTTLITEYSPPARFVDEQLKGPYSLWHHTHTFEACDGGTKITDEVRYVMPLGVLGELARMLFVKRQLQVIFDYRKQAIENYFVGNEREV